jgi:hypothetical protein
MAKVLPEKWEVNLYWKEVNQEWQIDVFDIGDGTGGYFKLLVSFHPSIPRQVVTTLDKLRVRNGGEEWYTELDCPNWIVGQINYYLNKQD